MLPIQDFNFQDVEYTTIRTGKKVTYINLEAGFDIETSSVEMQEEKAAFMYIWMFGIGYGNEVYYGRTWEELQTFTDQLSYEWGLGKEKRLIIYVHNLSYEFQFMRKYFEWSDMFNINERKPLKALTINGIEFRDSYILSGFSLAKTAENLQTHTVAKLEGDLDYSLIRTPLTPMTDTELGYCENDIQVILAYINEQITLYGDIAKIPLTNTGRVRKFVKHNCYFTNKNHRKSNRGKYERYSNIMKDLTLSVDDYLQLKQAFMGGYTHANKQYMGQTLQQVTSIDFTSSYPSVMLSEQFPMSRPKAVQLTSIQDLDDHCLKYAMLFNIKLTNVKPRIEQDNYISESKCFQLKGATVNNGRVYSADSLAMTITDVDYDIIKQTYTWDDIEVSNVKRFHRGYLPKAIVESVLTLYQDKTQLKGVIGKETEYMLSKGMLNSIYGMTVTDIAKDSHIYENDEWGVEAVDFETEIDKYNKSKNRFLYYAWGVWITAYARKNLWTGILAMGDDYVYSDTDSIKVLNYEKHLPYINWYNESVIHKMNLMCEYYQLDSELLKPKTIEGVEKMIGVWDYEGCYNNFKTLGAKRYLVQQGGKLELTVAGLSKQNGVQYMINQCRGDLAKVFELFNDELYIPADRTGKMTHTYIDDYQEFMIQDYQGTECKIEVESGVHLSPCEFTLSISRQYQEFLKQLSKGYIYKGVSYT